MNDPQIFLKKGNHLYCKQGHEVALITRDVYFGDKDSHFDALDFKYGTKPPAAGENIHYAAEKFTCKKCGSPWFFINEHVINYYLVKLT